MTSINSTDPIDLALDDAGDLAIPLRFTTGTEAVAQGIRVRLGNFKGEWFLDLDDGMPWFQSILGERFREAEIREYFREAIAGAPGVTSIVSLEFAFSAQLRSLDVSWEVVTVFGDTVSDALAV